MQPHKIHLLVKPFPTKTMTENGLAIPENAQERPSKATVLAVGSGTGKTQMILKEGDTVFHVKGAGNELELYGEKIWLIRSTDCLAYIPKNN